MPWPPLGAIGSCLYNIVSNKEGRLFWNIYPRPLSKGNEVLSCFYIRLRPDWL